MSVKAINKAERDYDITVVLRADATLYTGAVKGLVKKQEFQHSLKAKCGE